ncbi:hypothetical protein FH972_026614 [Carpinus fangiana]|uniref:Uroporphyrinogen decarboxylase n=1 Tax=Carpinus fangiana TaxID=176857 RepID=A0A5N6L4I7_9ROSI|nr:hypothetical protein FH972_026614 [Carpinus fangiana]
MPELGEGCAEVGLLHEEKLSEGQIQSEPEKGRDDKPEPQLRVDPQAKSASPPHHQLLGLRVLVRTWHAASCPLGAHHGCHTSAAPPSHPCLSLLSSHQVGMRPLVGSSQARDFYRHDYITCAPVFRAASQGAGKEAGRCGVSGRSTCDKACLRLRRLGRPLQAYAVANGRSACSFPIIVRRFPRLPIPHRFLFLSRHFGTGVLIATAFVHLLPTAFVSLTDPCLPSFWNEGYPAMPGFVAMVSVLVVVGIEMFFATRGAGHSHSADLGALTGGAHTADGNGLYTRPTDSPEAALIVKQGGGFRHFRTGSIGTVDPNAPVRPANGGLHGRRQSSASGASLLFERPQQRSDSYNMTEINDNTGAWNDEAAVQGRRMSDEETDLEDSPRIGGASSPDVPRAPHRQKTVEEDQKFQDQKALLQCLMLEAGILFHSIFIGMALSVATGTPFIVLLIAISFHQTFEGLALGSRIAAVSAFGPGSIKPWLMALAYGTTTPIGQAIGLGVHNLYDPASETGLLMVGLMNAISSGLLLFAGLVELLAEDFLSDHSYEILYGRKRLEACAAVVAGSMLMALREGFCRVGTRWLAIRRVRELEKVRPPCSPLQTRSFILQRSPGLPPIADVSCASMNNEQEGLHTVAAAIVEDDWNTGYDRPSINGASAATMQTPAAASDVRTSKWRVHSRVLLTLVLMVGKQRLLSPQRSAASRLADPVLVPVGGDGGGGRRLHISALAAPPTPRYRLCRASFYAPRAEERMSAGRLALFVLQRPSTRGLYPTLALARPSPRSLPVASFDGRNCKARRARPWSTAKGSNSSKANAAARATPSPDALPASAATSNPSVVKAISPPGGRLGHPPRSPTLDFIVNPPLADAPAASALRKRKQSHAVVRAQDLSVELVHDPRTVQCGDCRSALVRYGAQKWCQKCEYARVSAINRTRDVFVDGSLDPFGVMPIKMDPKTANFTTHWLSHLSPGAIPIDINHKSTLVRKDVFGISMNCKGAMHGLLCSAALHSFILGRATIVDVMHHKQLAIAEVNKALLDPVQCVSDGNIFAVFTLLCLEESMMLPMFKKPEQTQNEAGQRMVHLMGLKKMIEMRGGLRALTSAPLLQAFIIWHAVAHSVASFYPPYLDFGLTEQDGGYPHAPNFTYPACYFVFTNLGHALSTHSSLIRIAQDLSLYTVQLEDWFGNPTSHEDPVDLQNRGCLLECRLLEFYSTPESEREHDPIEDSICLALLAYTSTIKQTKDRSFEPMQLAGLKKLKACLLKTRAEHWAKFPLALLWTLVTGAITAIGAVEAPWFAAQIRRACSLFGIRSFSHMVAHMEQLLWLDMRTAQPAARMWDSITDRNDRTMWAEKAEPAIFNGMPFFGPSVPDPTVRSSSPDRVDLRGSPGSDSTARKSGSSPNSSATGATSDYPHSAAGHDAQFGDGVGVPGLTSRSPSLASRNLPFRLATDERRDETYIFNDVGYDAVRVWTGEEFQPPAPQTVDRRQAGRGAPTSRPDEHRTASTVFVPPTSQMSEWDEYSGASTTPPRRSSIVNVPTAYHTADSTNTLWSIENIALLPRLEQPPSTNARAGMRARAGPCVTHAESRQTMQSAAAQRPGGRVLAWRFGRSTYDMEAWSGQTRGRQPLRRASWTARSRKLRGKAQGGLLMPDRGVFQELDSRTASGIAAGVLIALDGYVAWNKQNGMKHLLCCTHAAAPGTNLGFVPVPPARRWSPRLPPSPRSRPPPAHPSPPALPPNRPTRGAPSNIDAAVGASRGTWAPARARPPCFSRLALSPETTHLSIHPAGWPLAVRRGPPDRRRLGSAFPHSTQPAALTSPRAAAVFLRRTLQTNILPCIYFALCRCFHYFRLGRRQDSSIPRPRTRRICRRALEACTDSRLSQPAPLNLQNRKKMAESSTTQKPASACSFTPACPVPLPRPACWYFLVAPASRTAPPDPGQWQKEQHTHCVHARHVTHLQPLAAGPPRFVPAVTFSWDSSMDAAPAPSRPGPRSSRLGDAWWVLLRLHYRPIREFPSRYIGRYLAKYIHDNNLASELRLVDRIIPEIAWLSPEFAECCSRDNFMQADACNEQSYTRIFTPNAAKEYDYVFNCGGESRFSQSDETYRLRSYTLSQLLARECIRRNTTALIECSTGMVYAGSNATPAKENDSIKPWTPLAKWRVKAAAEFKDIEGLNLVALRLANVYGPYARGPMSTVLCLGRCYQEKRRLHGDEVMKWMWDKDLCVNTVHVEDAVRALWTAGEWKGRGGGRGKSRIDDNGKSLYPVFNIVDHGRTTQGTLSGLIGKQFGIETGFHGRLKSNLARLDLDNIVEEENEEVLEVWAELVEKSERMGPRKNAVPISPFVETELLQDRHLSLDGGLFERVTGFTYTRQALDEAAMQEVIKSYEDLGHIILSAIHSAAGHSLSLLSCCLAAVRSSEKQDFRLCLLAKGASPAVSHPRNPTPSPAMASAPNDFPPLKNDLLLRTARNEDVSHPPIWVMRQAGRYLPEYHEEKAGRDFFACCRDPEVASNLTLQPIDRFDGLIDAAIIFSDILVVPQALGMEVVMLDKAGPHFPHPLRSPADAQFAAVLAKQVDVAAELGYVFDALRVTRRKLAGRVPLYGFCGAPWTLLCYMVEGGGSKLFREIKGFVYTHPAEAAQLLQKIADVCVEYLALQVAAGAQILQVFDSWAGELGPAAFRRFALPYLVHIATQLPKRLEALGLERVPMVVFAKGAPYAFDYLLDTPYDVIGLDWLFDPAQAYAMAQAKGKVVQGNMDPGVLYGSEEAIEEAVRECVRGFGGGKKGWICNLGHGVTPFIDREKLRFFFEKVREYTEGGKEPYKILIEPPTTQKPAQLHLATLLDHDIPLRPLLPRPHILNHPHHLHTLLIHHLAKHNMLPIQKPRLRTRDKELTTIRPRPRVRHTQQPRPRVAMREALVGKRAPVDGVAAGAVARGEVARLHHEAFDDAVEAHAAVADGLGRVWVVGVARFAGAELPEVFGGAGRGGPGEGGGEVGRGDERNGRHTAEGYVEEDYGVAVGAGAGRHAGCFFVFLSFGCLSGMLLDWAKASCWTRDKWSASGRWCPVIKEYPDAQAQIEARRRDSALDPVTALLPKKFQTCKSKSPRAHVPRQTFPDLLSFCWGPVQHISQTHEAQGAHCRDRYKQFPQRYEFDEEEYNRIASMTKRALEDAKEDARDAGAKEEDVEMVGTKEKKSKKDKKSKKSKKEDDDDSANEDNDLKEFDLEHYDDDDDPLAMSDGEGGARGGDAMGMFGSVKNLAYHTSNTEDPYITLPAGANGEQDEEEREELQIMPTDNLVLAARVEDEVAHLEIYVYEDAEDNLYVHHDVMLPAIPLAVEWLNVRVGSSRDKTQPTGPSTHGNFVAVGTLDPDIEIWDLDTVDCMYPAAILGAGHASSAYAARGTGKKKRRAKHPSPAHHTDAVLALAANPLHRNLLASASADRTVKLWDLHTAGSASAAAQQSYDALHTDKICSLAWHAQQPSALLSGGYDAAAVASDVRAPDAAPRRWTLDSDVESVRWDPHAPDCFYVACESGMLHYFDARVTPAAAAGGKRASSAAVWRLQAHDGAVSAFDANAVVPGLLATGGGDGAVKLWNVPRGGGGPSMVVSRDLDVGKVFSATFAPDAEVGFRLAVAGSAGQVRIWDTSTNKAVRQAFAGRVAKGAAEEVEERLVGLTVDDESSSDEGEDEGEDEEGPDGGWEDGVEDEDEDEEGDDNDDEMSE